MESVSKEVPSGEDVMLSCLVSGISQAVDSITWKKNGLDVTTISSTNYLVGDGSFSDNSQTTTLEIKGAANTEDVTFTCDVDSNEWGYAGREAFASAFVFGKN